MIVRPETVGRLILHETDSTNAEAQRQAMAGERGPIWILAHRQTAARGRLGRVWESQVGNLAASLLLQVPGEPGPAASRLVQTAALAVADTCSVYRPASGADIEVAIKWPNDVLLCGKKVAGILIENLGPAPGPVTALTVVVGIGINLRHHPPAEDTRWPATSLSAEGLDPPEAVEVLDHLNDRVCAWLSESDDRRLAAWRAHLHGLGQRIEARLPGGTVPGIFDGVDADGQLVLRTPQGQRRIAAADIFFPETA